MGNKGTKAKHQPEAMDDLLQTTMFSQEEIQAWYKNFLKVSAQGHSVIKVSAQGHST